jgi:hypothetical protein
VAESNTVAAKREWVALQTTALKASKALSTQLANNEKLMVPEGARLSALLTGENSDHWLVKKATVDGVTVADMLGYIYKGHWKLEGGIEEKSLFPQTQLEATVAFSDYAENRARHRRLYAAFRRRLSHR